MFQKCKAKTSSQHKNEIQVQPPSSDGVDERKNKDNASSNKNVESPSVAQNCEQLDNKLDDSSSSVSFNNKTDSDHCSSNDEKFVNENT